MSASEQAAVSRATEETVYGSTQQRYDAAMAEAARDRAERADPDLARLVYARDNDAAAGHFDSADVYQRVIDDGMAKLAAERAQGQAKAREMAARDAHERFPFWADRDRPERGPTDRPGVRERADREVRANRRAGRERVDGNDGRSDEQRAIDRSRARDRRNERSQR